MRVVVAGGTGFLGSSLVAELQRTGTAVTALTRRPTAPHHAGWDPGDPDATWAPVLDGADAVVSLTGVTISRRWTAAYKQKMRESRVAVTRALVRAMARVDRRPPVFVSGSAVGIYGSRGDETLTEESPTGTGFLPELAVEWEQEALAASAHARVVLVRTGVVLDRAAGALPLMALPFRLFAGGPTGSGRQYLSWIHRHDWVTLVRWALGNAAVTGPLNATAPGPVTNREFARTLGRALGRPAVLPAPAFVLRLVLGEMSEVVLDGQRVVPDKARALGFDFRYPTLEEALRAIYAR